MEIDVDMKQVVILRPIKIADYELLYSVINDPETVRFNAPYSPVHEIEHNEWLEKLLKDKSKQFFMIDYSNKTIGSAQLVDINHIHKNAEIKIRIFSDKYRGKGLGTKAIDLLCAHAFNDLGLIRVWLRVFANNIRAITAYAKSGFNVEGTMKKAAFINGEFLDIIVMAKINE